MFSEILKNISWQETMHRIYDMNDCDVIKALRKQHLDITDFMALVSPAALPHLEEMAQKSKRLTEQRFGKTISLFIPL